MPILENEPSLATLLTKKKNELMKMFPETAKAEIMASTKRLSEKYTESELKVGDKAPSFELSNSLSNQVSLDKLLQDNKFIVLTWYRGAWCPYCNVALHALVKINDQIKQLGGQLVALTPELPDESLSFKEKLELPFEVLSDVKCEVAEKYGIMFDLDQGTVDTYEGLGIKITSINGNDKTTLPKLPVPATFVLDSNGKIVYRYVEFDYTQRAEPKDIIAAAESI